jgi:hypothetical protein
MKITFNIPDAQVPRISEWIEAKHFPVDPQVQPPAPTPTDADLLQKFREMIREYIKDQLQQYELLKEHEVVYQQYTPIDVTDE